MDDGAVDLCAGQADVNRLVLLQPQIDPLAPLDELTAVGADQIGQLPLLTAPGKTLPAQKIPHMALADLLLQGYFIAGGIDVAKQFSLSAHIAHYSFQMSPIRFRRQGHRRQHRRTSFSRCRRMPIFVSLGARMKSTRMLSIPLRFAPRISVKI